MPTKIAPKAVAKPLAKSIGSKVAVDPKAKEKADRLQLIVSIVGPIAETIVAAREAEKAAQSAWFTIADTATEAIDDNGLSQEEGEQALKLAFAEAYGLDVEELSGKDAMKNNPMAYNYLSKIKRLVFPVDEKQAKELKKARAKGVTVADALKLARTPGLLASQIKASAGKGKKIAVDGTVTRATGAIEDEDTLGNALAAVISKAVKGEMSIETIEEVFATQLAEYQAAAEGSGEAEE